MNQIIHIRNVKQYFLHLMERSKQMMTAKTLSHLQKQKLSPKEYIISIIDSKEFDGTVCRMIRKTEKMTIWFQIVRNGLNQSDTKIVNSLGFRRYNWMDWLITINVLINVIRCGVLSCNTSDSIAVFLGDPLFHVKGGKALLMWCSIATILMHLFREYILFLEARGKFKVLSVWKFCSDGFNPSELRMSKLNTKKFRLTVYIVSLIIYCMMLSIPLLCTFLYFSLMLNNFWIYEMPKLAFFAFVWSFPFIFSLAILFIAIMGFGWYIMCALYFYLYRLRDLIDRVDLLLENSKLGLLIEKDVQYFCSLIIGHLNAFEIVSFKLRYVLLCYFFIISSGCDFDLFLGTIIRTFDLLFCNLIAFGGFSVLISIALFGLIFGSFMTQLCKLTKKLHQLSRKNKFSMATFIKILEIMDRAAGPYNGLKVGDFVTLEKKIFILFIVESISTLMLFTVNIRPMILSRSD